MSTDLDDELRAAVDRRLAARLADTRRRRERRNEIRDEKARRRTAGLKLRHRRKLARNPQEGTGS